jgi:ADP-dependent NAD(P)H-hydrate dehydratase / NAD(P)H-hydrate epimerase
VNAPDWLEPLYDAAGMGGMDRWAIEERGVPSLDLMEVAGGALARETELVARSGPIRIVCGKGNNGGDGMVAARLLRGAGHEVEVLSIWSLDDLSPDSSANLERLDGGARRVDEGDWPAAVRGSGAIVDAIFGTGFDGAPRGAARAAIEAINGAGAPVVACDVASGVDASSGEVAGAAVHADLTVTFHAPKVGHRIAPGKAHTGRLVVAPIGIPDGAPGTPVAGVIAEPVLDLPPRRGAASTKFSSGDVFVVGGSRGLTGAPSMASLAAIRAGAGYATVGCPEDLEPILEVKLTEVMTIGLEQVGGGLGAAAAAPILERAERSACVVLGPGLGRLDHSLRLARELAPRIPVPLLIDADGLNALGTDLGLLRSREAATVLTPHAGELGRLLGCDSEEISAHRLAKARLASAEAGAVVVLKGDDSIVADGDRIAVNALESPGLATAGTGDVLSGTIGALIARGCEPFAAACAGVYAHARAGRSAARRVGAESVIAGDVIEALPEGLAR